MPNKRVIPADKRITCRCCGTVAAIETVAAQHWYAIGSRGATTGFLCPECRTNKAALDDLETLNSAASQLHRGLRKRKRRRADSTPKGFKALYR